uniref:IL6Ra-bind domain-containing protein n=1 Tax=Elaeophora elaphi TaxID=1147741 RepID=A0A0R3RP73_9BILA
MERRRNEIIKKIYLSTCTNNWLYTTEVLKYYVHPNDTRASGSEDILDQTVYFKNATLGPWLFCWLDPTTDFHCTKVNYFTTEEPYDVTTSVESSVHRAFIFMISGAALIILGLTNAIICHFQKWPYHSLMCCSVLHIFSGMNHFTKYLIL